MFCITKGRKLTRKLLGNNIANSLSRPSILAGRSRKDMLLKGMLGKAMESEVSSLAKIIRKNLLEFPGLSKGL